MITASLPQPLIVTRSPTATNIYANGTVSDVHVKAAFALVLSAQAYMVGIYQ